MTPPGTSRLLLHKPAGPTSQQRRGGDNLLAKCSGITQAGTACKGIPIDGSQWCYAHHPDRTDERRRHGSSGASVAAVDVPQWNSPR